MPPTMRIYRNAIKTKTILSQYRVIDDYLVMKKT